MVHDGVHTGISTPKENLRADPESIGKLSWGVSEFKRSYCNSPHESALPNFAMTDYASQGKTHLFNVVDLTECRSHQGYYTALSRSATASGTLILTSFHPSKITGGASEALHQEFWELELLDNITMLRFKNLNDKLPRKITMADQRNTLISLFQEYKGKNYILSTVHEAIRWTKSDPFLEWKDDVDW